MTSDLVKMSQVFLKAAQTTSVTAAEVSAKVNPIFGVSKGAIDQNSVAAQKINQILGSYQGMLNIYVTYSKAGVASVKAVTDPVDNKINSSIEQHFNPLIKAAINAKTVGLPQEDLGNDQISLIHPVVDYH